jgi:predicted O-linked N-acetylglucosamine transferase (SPINDLY family)
LDALLGDILRRDPRGIVVLIGVPYYNYTELLQRRLERALGAAATRVMFLDPLPYARFLQLLALADVILDTPHFNGMNTSLEGFSMGTPIVTLPGRMQRGRHTQAMYRKMGILECIATDDADYVDIAVRLGCDRGHADALRERILARCHVLYEDPRVVTEFERFFLTAVAAASPHQSGTDSGEGGSPRA